MGLGRSSWEHPRWAVMLTDTQPGPRGDAGAPNPHPSSCLMLWGYLNPCSKSPPHQPRGSRLCVSSAGFALPRPCSSPGSSWGPRGAPFVSADLLTTCEAGEAGAAALIGGVSCLLSITQLASAHGGKPQRPATGWGVGILLKSTLPIPPAQLKYGPSSSYTSAKGLGDAGRVQPQSFAVCALPNHFSHQGITRMVGNGESGSNLQSSCAVSLLKHPPATLVALKHLCCIEMTTIFQSLSDHTLAHGQGKPQEYSPPTPILH